MGPSPLLDAVSAIIGFVAVLSAPAYVLLQIWAPIRLANGWRSAALAPLVLSVPLLVWCAYAFADQSNLGPVPYILFAPFGTFYLVLMLNVGRKARRAGPA